ncbi:uncharacterized protein LOC113870097 [Abrus precatorius]|uniref:Uncharacterized protein LOC113870097 n=1 Tax=Abrus precatorius TaxID=3816 RepID=A0A8B8M3G1_ABRPR|nr:uncharacterized protein LOC113870097 [Abrus precatorius]
MKTQNISEDSTTDPNNKSPPSSPEHPPSDETHHTLNQTNDQGSEEEGERETLMKTPWEVLEELGDGGGSGKVGGSRQSGVSVAGNGGGGARMVESGEVGSEGILVRKRKASELREIPSGKPICPLCLKEFLTWKGAFGHMRKHPERAYRGFFKPPVFGSTSTSVEHSLQDHTGESAEGKSGEKGSAPLSPIPEHEFDLNQPMESFHNVDPTEEEKVEEERRKLRFDLNEMPSTEDDDE